MEITKEQFEIFKQEINDLIRLFGLYDWEVEIFHEKIDSIAEIQTNLVSRYAKIILAIEYKTELSTSEIKNTALHEILHLLIASFCDTDFDSTEAENRNEEQIHAFIQRMIHFIHNIQLETL